MLVQISMECSQSHLSTGISNLLQPAQAEVVSGQLSTHLASWDETSAAANTVHLILMGLAVAEYIHSIPGPTNLESTITDGK